MDLNARRQALADRHQRNLAEYGSAVQEFVELSQPDPLTGRVWRTSKWRAARFRVRRAARALHRSQPKRYTR
ncbi:hypothetical protein EV651_103596 [Kribbella sp. VKM Ac-2571]|uniref:hypothetical protein n=1 Tax=Kribbella sp. VKM Ac-2571 TaxID=2512222 RepID=UPI0010612477|nr:hypothetical protein [Kribbella sp. VKM Ac-2571]TDO67682.1 hypothetical protein EV651_103596 [Kribbella sp. VKM Ac-2571]